jgi:hypothetical protein
VLLLLLDLPPCVLPTAFLFLLFVSASSTIGTFIVVVVVAFETSYASTSASIKVELGAVSRVSLLGSRLPCFVEVDGGSSLYACDCDVCLDEVADAFAAFSFARTRAASASRSVAANLAAIEAMVSGD